VISSAPYDEALPFGFFSSLSLAIFYEFNGVIIANFRLSSKDKSLDNYTQLAFTLLIDMVLYITRTVAFYTRVGVATVSKFLSKAKQMATVATAKKVKVGQEVIDALKARDEGITFLKWSEQDKLISRAVDALKKVIGTLGEEAKKLIIEILVFVKQKINEKVLPRYGEMIEA